MNEAEIKTALVFIGHGSRDEMSNLQMQDFTAKYAEVHPEYSVHICFIEFSKPDMNEFLFSISEKYGKIIIMPLVFYKSGHAKNDIASVVKELKEKFTKTEYLTCGVLGTHHLLSELNLLRASETGIFGKKYKNISALFVSRGSSDPDANASFYRQARFLEESGKFSRVVPCFEGVAKPGIDESMDFLIRSRPDAVVLVLHFLFRGVLTERIKEKVNKYKKDFPWVQFYAADEMGIHENVFRLIDDRISQALTGKSALECDNCKYRHSMPGHEEHRGGLTALLWSIRHRFSHGLAVDEHHSHAKIKKHVLVCGNTDCASKGSIRFLNEIKRLLKLKAMAKEFAVTQTSCMGHCSEGPTVVVYPDGIWYSGVSESDADDIVEKHLNRDEPVARLVDTIM